MNIDAKEIYVSPFDHQPMKLHVDLRDDDEAMSGVFVSGANERYQIIRGVPYFVVETSRNDSKTERQTKSDEYYRTVGDTYDVGMDWLFAGFYEDEDKFRNRMVDLLELGPDQCVLEVGAGTCRDTIQIARRLGTSGKLFVQDLSPEMLEVGRRRMAAEFASQSADCRVEYFVSDASTLSFSENYLDALFCFGGLNEFPQKQKSLDEFARVVKPSGRVVVGDEGVAPWLHESEYGQILVNSNRLYRHQLPLDCLPRVARDVQVRWVLGNAFYIITFTVGESPPKLDLDLPIPGARGGTHRTRYFGALEGVTPETRNLVHAAAKAQGVSIHEWLESTLRKAAKESSG